MLLPPVLDDLAMLRMIFVVLIAMVFALSRHRPVIEFAGFAVIMTYQMLHSLLWIYWAMTSTIHTSETVEQSFEWWGMAWFPTFSSIAAFIGLLTTLYLGIRAQRPGTGYSPRQRICIAAATLCVSYGAVVCANTHSAFSEMLERPVDTHYEE